MTIPKTFLLEKVSVLVFTGRGTWRKGSTNAIVLELEASCPEMVLALAFLVDEGERMSILLPARTRQRRGMGLLLQRGDGSRTVALGDG